MKFWKRIILCLLMAMVLLSFAGCDGFEPDLSDLPDTGVPGVDFEEEIDDYVEDSFNVVILSKGDKEKAHKADYVLGSNGGVCLSSDKSVATVSDRGVIKAKGKGCCYVIVIGEEFMGDRDVQITKVLVDAPVGMQIDAMMSGAPAFVRTFFKLFLGLIAVAIVAVPVGLVILLIYTKRKNAKPAENAGQPVYHGTAAPAAPSVKRCPECGAQVEDAFCPYCGHRV